MDEMTRLRKLQHPEGIIDVVLDTDTFNEIDDQYALSYLVRSTEKVRLKAIYAAPFSNEKARTPEEGMEKSHAEILKLLALLKSEDLKGVVYKGARSYLKDEKTPVMSPAAEDLVRRALSYPEDRPLYVVGIAAITDIASAILLSPEIIDHIVVVWLGGNAFSWPDNTEFNMFQDIAAARVVFSSGVPLVMLPCKGVVTSFTTTGPELEYHLRGKNRLCDYLVDITEREAVIQTKLKTWSRPIWDVTAAGWLMDGGFMEDCLVPAPVPEYDDRWGTGCRRHLARYVYHIWRDKLMDDLFRKLSGVPD